MRVQELFWPAPTPFMSTPFSRLPSLSPAESPPPGSVPHTHADAVLVAAVEEGSSRAAADLWDRFSPMVRRVIRVRDRFDGVVDAQTALMSRAQFLQKAAPRNRGFDALALGLAGALACVVIWVSLPTAVTVTTQGVVLSKNGSFVAAATPAVLAFSDGSQLKIAPGSSGQLDRLDKHGAGGCDAFFAT